METNVPVQFDIYQGDRLVRTEILTERTIKIGKLSSSHVRLDDESVSRMHAVVEVSGPDNVVLLDLGSAQGTFVNGERITKRLLTTGDQLQVGEIRVVVKISGQRVQQAAPAAAAPAGHTGQPAAAVQAAVMQRAVPLFDEEEEDRGGPRALEVLAMWGNTVLDVRHYSEEGVYTVGQKAGVSHFVSPEAVPDDPYPLARTDGSDMVVNLPQGAQGEVMLDGQVYALDDLRSAGKLGKSADAPNSLTLRLPPRARCRLALGELTFLINSVPAAQKVAPMPWYRQFDKQIVTYVLASAVLHLVFKGVIGMIPDDARDLNLDAFDMSDRWVEFILKPESEQVEEKNVFDLKEDEGKAAEKAREEEGKAGKKDAESTNNRMAIEGPKDQETIELARERQKKIAIQAADATFEQLDNELSSVWGTQDRAIGNDAVTALGNMFGDQVGESEGLNGLGVAGMGRGGGGFSENSLGVGRMGTKGRGGGGDAGYGRGVSRVGRKKLKEPKVIPGNPIINGSLDPEIIRRIIRQHRSEYQYCYSKQLQVKRDLAGKIKVKFTISGTGQVIAAKVMETTMNDAAVERCLIGKIKRWRFPEPKGGGIVVVKYPFVFKAS
ncbi:MAG: AgmX/PglI C-terminal domain-containing protein [Bradymonadia bacterium]